MCGIQELEFFGDLAASLDDPCALLADEETPSGNTGINRGDPWQPAAIEVEATGKPFAAIRLSELAGCWLFCDVVDECFKLVHNANKNANNIVIAKKLNATYKAGIGRLVK